jgi:hypothetical protein
MQVHIDDIQDLHSDGYELVDCEIVAAVLFLNQRSLPFDIVSRRSCHLSTGPSCRLLYYGFSTVMSTLYPPCIVILNARMYTERRITKP